MNSKEREVIVLAMKVLAKTALAVLAIIAIARIMTM